MLDEGDLLVTMTDLSKQSDTLGYPALVPASTDGRSYLHNQRLGKVLPKGNVEICTRYLYYVMCTDQYRHEVLASATGTTVKHTSPDRIKEFRFMLPPLAGQEAIAHVLGTLDDKIELNRRMNRTLEEMARALFKSWFVDFDPVCAKMEGRWRQGESLPGLPANLYDLFPDRLVTSELGEIPQGWEVRALREELEALFSGKRPRGGAVDAGIPSIGAENIDGLGQHDYSKEKYIPSDLFGGMKSKGRVIRNGDVLLYKDGAHIGRKTYVDCDFPYRECTVNEHVFIARLGNRHAQRYLFFWLDQDWMTEEIASLNSNSAQPGINKEGVRSLPILVPSPDVLSKFGQEVGNLTSRIFANCHESRALAGQRHSLLPELVSGKVRVVNRAYNDAEPS